MVIDLLLAGVPGADPSGVAEATTESGDEAGAGACGVGGAGGAAAELEAALGLRMVSMSSAAAPAWLSRIISAVERSNLLFFDDLTWLTITEVGTWAWSISSTPWLVSTESAGRDTEGRAGHARTAQMGAARHPRRG